MSAIAIRASTSVEQVLPPLDKTLTAWPYLTLLLMILA